METDAPNVGFMKHDGKPLHISTRLSCRSMPWLDFGEMAAPQAEVEEWMRVDLAKAVNPVQRSPLFLRLVQAGAEPLSLVSALSSNLSRLLWHVTGHTTSGRSLHSYGRWTSVSRKTYHHDSLEEWSRSFVSIKAICAIRAEIAFLADKW